MQSPLLALILAPIFPVEGPTVGRLWFGTASCPATPISPTQVITLERCLEKGGEPQDDTFFQDNSGHTQRASRVSLHDLSDKVAVFEVPHPLEAHWSLGPLQAQKDLDWRHQSPDGLPQPAAPCRVDYLIGGQNAFAYLCPVSPSEEGLPLLQGNSVVGLHAGANSRSNGHVATLLTKSPRLIPNSETKSPEPLKNQEKGRENAVQEPPSTMRHELIIPAPIGLTGYPMWETSGGHCGSGITENLVPDYWGLPGRIADFNPACREHDECYERQRGKTFCDRRLRENLRLTCAATFDTSGYFLQKLECQEIVSTTYYVAVKNAGGRAYERCGQNPRT